MEKTFSLDGIISVASDIRKLIDSLLVSYQKLEPLVEKENFAIRQRNLNDMQKINQEKETLGEKISHDFLEVKKLIFKILDCYEKICRKKWQQQLGFKNVADMLDELEKQFSSENLSHKVFIHITAEIRSRSILFKETFDKIQPHIERNRTVLRTMLENHRRSYRFWSQIEEQESSSYNAEGVKKTSGKTSLFQVRA